MFGLTLKFLFREYFKSARLPYKYLDKQIVFFRMTKINFRNESTFNIIITFEKLTGERTVSLVWFSGFGRRCRPFT